MSVKQNVILKLEREEYGIDIQKVAEIVLYQEIRQVPDAPRYIEGLINLRGEIYPIYNLRTRFAMEPREADEETKILIIRTAQMNIGFIVDSVSEIINIPVDNIEDTPAIIDLATDERYIQGIAKQDGRMIVLLDIDQLVSSKDYKIMNKIREK